MKIINVDINDEIIFKNVLDTDTGVITGISSVVKLPTGNYNNIKLNFSFANQKLCEKFNIFASFKINNGTPIIQELEPMTIGDVTYERACNIPNEVFENKCEVTLGVYGYRLNEDETLDKRFSLVPVRNFVVEGSYNPDSEEGIIPTPTVFDIYFDKVSKAEKELVDLMEQTETAVDNKLNAIQTDYDTFKAEKEEEVDNFLNNAEGQFMGTVNQLEADFEETQKLVNELETAVDEAEDIVNNMQTVVDKIPGDLYTVDRYNLPTITYDGTNYINNLSIPLTSYEVGKIVNIEGSSYEGVNSFENPHLNINNLGAKQINGTIEAGGKYSLVYNGESFDIYNPTKIVTGSYTGTGTYGASNPTTLDLGFKPKFVIINWTAYYSIYYCDRTQNYTQYFAGSNTTGATIFDVPYDNGIKWYSTKDANFQLNASNGTYHYFAIG